MVFEKIFGNIGTPARRKIVAAVLGVLSLAQMPSIGPKITAILSANIVEPVTVGVFLGAVGIVGTIMIWLREGM
jgi:hypothetical protein